MLVTMCETPFCIVAPVDVYWMTSTSKARPKHAGKPNDHPEKPNQALHSSMFWHGHPVPSWLMLQLVQYVNVCHEKWGTNCVPRAVVVWLKTA